MLANALTENALIHVGIPKAGSTYLPSWFANHRGCGYTTAQPMVDLALSLARSPEPLESLLSRPHDLPKVAPCRAPGDGQPYVISNEAFALYAIGSDTFTEAFCRRYLQIACALLKQWCPQGRILVVTCGPASWLTSTYNQYVRGPRRVRPFRVFLRTSWPCLRTNLDYQFLRDIYVQAFGEDRVLFLPQEMLEDDPQGFCDRIEAFGQFTNRGEVDGAFHDRPPNLSLTPSEVEKLRRLRGFLRLLYRTSPRSSELSALEQRGLRGKFTIDDLISDFIHCFISEPESKIARILRLVMDRLPEPAPALCDRTVPVEKLEQLAAQMRFLADRPEYQRYGKAYHFHS